MNKRQKIIVAKFIAVIAITAIATIIMINIKDLINRAEGVRAMKQLGQELLKHDSLPPESFVDAIKDEIQGRVRLGKIQYRNLWITPDAEPNEILAYTKKNYKSLFINDGYIVLMLNGNVEWMGKKHFEELLKSQQTTMEIQATK